MMQQLRMAVLGEVVLVLRAVGMAVETRHCLIRLLCAWALLQRVKLCFIREQWILARVQTPLLLRLLPMRSASPFKT